MKKHNNKLIRFFQILIASLMFSLLTFCSSLKAQESFTQNFPSTCYDVDVLMTKIGDYTVLQSELMYADKEYSIFDVMIAVKSSKKVLIVREVKGKVNFACLISEFTQKKRV